MNKKKRVLPIVAAMLLISTMLLATASVTTGADVTAQAAEDQPPDPPDRHPDFIRASRSDTNMFLMETESQSIALTTTTLAPTTTATKPPRPKPTRPIKPAQSTAKTKTAPTTTPPPTSTGGNQAIVAVALTLVGKSYRSGGTGPDSFDCSGLVYYVLNQAGVSVPRLTSDGYYARYSKITRNDLQPGDLLVSSGHIGIYIGGGQMVHASTPRGGVKRASMDAPKPFGFVRVSSLP